MADKAIDRPESKVQKAKVIDNFVANSKLDGYSPSGSLAKKSLEVMKAHEGSDDELHGKLIKVFGG